MSPALAEGPFKALLFDVDGTLVDSLQQCIRGLSDMYAKYADRTPSDSEIRALMGIPLKKQVRLFTGREISEVEAQERIAYTIGRYEVHGNLVIEFAPAVEALCLAKRRGFATALVTSKNRTEVEMFLRHFRAASQADVIVCADDVEHPKPNPESARLALDKLGVRPHEAVMIGDSIFDLQCARSAGVASIAVLYGAGREQDLLAHSPDLVFRTPDEVLDWVRAPEPQPCLERK